MALRIQDDPDPTPLTPARPVSPERRLAGAVLLRAVADVRGRLATTAERADARRFLTDADGSLTFWLSVMGLPPQGRAAARERLRARVNGHGQRELRR
jgi:hypothetical protein